MEEIEKICPVCRGSCSCKACLRGDNMIKVRIREIPVLDKLQYLCCLLSAVLPVIRQIHQIQCSEVELEKRLHGLWVDSVTVDDYQGQMLQPYFCNTSYCKKAQIAWSCDINIKTRHLNFSDYKFYN